ncbi:U-box domain-containing protein 33-like isoform X4 [Carya illinoinensis]|uniref:U-box domain-containing protein 33-like isoform X4 n=1 Tax=Carya illinoinensis TaxID=32201 RepID=UPI001C7228B3|nr:U-box domain-containing protein 33-like isoform X4 [Carya illinoinensis]
MREILNKYDHFCGEMGVRAEILQTETETIEEGIVKLIAQYGVRRLVMGAAAKKHYNRNMMDLKSRKARYVCERAPVYCFIQFICKGHLIHTRKPRTDTENGESSLMMLRSQSVPSGNYNMNEAQTSSSNFFRSPYIVNSVFNGTFQGGTGELSSPNSRSEVERNSTSNNESDVSLLRSRRSSSTCSTYSPRRVIDSTRDQLILKPRTPLEGLFMSTAFSPSSSSVMDVASSNVVQENSLDNPHYEKLQQLMADAEKLALLQQKVARELGEAISKVERDSTVKEAEELRNKQGECSSWNNAQFTEFSLSEIKKATQNFHESLKIGGGGYGNIYKGNLHQIEVAIKRPHSQSLHSNYPRQGPAEFQMEVRVLSHLRHPNLVRLIGSCPEEFVLIYEYLPNGSLEDRLKCRDKSPPLLWKTRIRIAAELCSVLVYLHSRAPHSIVHGDLKPSNILLDANLVSKLSDFGICRMLCHDQCSNNNTTLCHITVPKGTPGYVDPEFLETGKLTIKSDVYSFGIILLQLLTNHSAISIANEVKNALGTMSLQAVLDPSAGDWPIVVAQSLAKLALWCCDRNQENRPKLGSDVLEKLESMRAST